MFSDPELQVAKIQAAGFISFEALRGASFLCPGKRPKLKLAGTNPARKRKRMRIGCRFRLPMLEKSPAASFLALKDSQPG
jgi:hypothetical protein